MKIQISKSDFGDFEVKVLLASDGNGKRMWYYDFPYSPCAKRYVVTENYTPPKVAGEAFETIDEAIVYFNELP